MLSDYVAYASGALAQALLLVERQHLQVFNLTIDHSGGGSRPSDKGGGGGGHPNPEILGGAQQNIFSVLRTSVWSENKEGAAPGPSPGSTTVF